MLDDATDSARNRSRASASVLASEIARASNAAIARSASATSAATSPSIEKVRPTSSSGT